MKKYFQKLYQYNAWANSQVLECLKKQKVEAGKMLSLMGHVAAAQLLWLHRVKGMPPPEVVLWGDYTLEEVIAFNERGVKAWLEYIAEENDFDRELQYTNYSGKPFNNNVEMIMIHVVNHGTYHRAQVAMLLRQSGLEPVNTDFITYDRTVRGQLP